MKKVIYYSDAGFPYSVLAAAIKTGKLPVHRKPMKEELLSVLETCGVGSGDARVYNYVNHDGSEECLALWTRGHGDMVPRAITSFLALYNVQDYELKVIKYKKPPLITAGTWLTRLPVLHGAGISLIHRGVGQVYADLINAV